MKRIGRPPVSKAQSFKGKYIIRPKTRCWIWVGTRFVAGYGRCKGGYAHRVSYELHNGPLPDGLFVCHRCDNPSCVNPEHLFLGTLQDNTADMVAKGRQAKGEKNGNAKLTASQVEAIRGSSGSQREAAALYGVSHATIGHIRNNVRWVVNQA